MKAGSEGPFRKNFGTGEGSVFKNNGDDPYDQNKQGYGTSSRHLKGESYQTRSKYKSWKRNQPRDSDRSFNAFLNSGKKKKKKKRNVKRKGGGSVRYL